MVGLLDTSTLLWTLATPERLSASARQLIETRQIARAWHLIGKSLSRPARVYSRSLIQWPGGAVLQTFSVPQCFRFA